jgi:hypothetical protein
MARLRSLMKRHIRLFMNLWPPFLGAGIRVTRLDRDWRAVDVEMKLRRWNANYVGTQYGGSLYSMTDPFLMLMLIENLGRDYIVWDKSACIRFWRPGRGTVRVSFRVTAAEVQEIRDALETGVKIDRDYSVAVKDAEGRVIAEIEKRLHISRKQRSG